MEHGGSAMGRLFDFTFLGLDSFAFRRKPRQERRNEEGDKMSCQAHHAISCRRGIAKWSFMAALFEGFSED
jgi:hypothetical protein